MAYTGVSIVDYLNSLGQDSSQANRKKLAAQYGISNYNYSAEANTALLNAMRSGKTPSTPATPATPATTNTGKTDPNQPYTDAEYAAAAKTNPIVDAHTKAGNTLDSLNYALTSGDLSGIVDTNGQPFSLKDQQAALDQGMKDNELYYSALKDKETKDAEDALAQKQADYQQKLATSKVNFESDKATLDQNAADRGVLFSGGRAQKERQLQSTYQGAQNYLQNTTGRDIASTARDYQSKYGNDSADSLSQYYKLGGQSYNPNVATGGATSNGLSSVYNTGASNYQGTTNVTQIADANKRAANYLYNKSNKLLSTGYTNQIK